MAGSTQTAGRRQDVIAGGVLLLFAIVWTITVWLTVPVGYGVGPRAFPLWLGVGLAVLSALLLLNGLFAHHAPAEAEVDDEDEPEAAIPPLRRFGILVMVCAIIAAFGWLMPKVGFLLATAITVAVTLVVPLGERRPLLVIGMAVGIAVGAWLAFGVVLGAYMPRGTWISIF